jgi:hypothetical protein
VWCGGLGNTLIGPLAIKGHFTAPYYRNFLSSELPLYLQDAPLVAQGQMWLQHHRTHPHFGTEVMEFFN